MHFDGNLDGGAEAGAYRLPHSSDILPVHSFSESKSNSPIVRDRASIHAAHERSLYWTSKLISKSCPRTDVIYSMSRKRVQLSDN
jgi:hypothetical protein